MGTVKLQQVSKRYEGKDSRLVLDNIDLEINEGEFLVLLGPSGCGKSTVLRIIAGLESMTTGEVFIGDCKVNNVSAKDRDVAMVFQNYALYPHMSVEDNIAFGLKMRGTPKAEIEQRVSAVADQLELTDFLKRKPAQLSGGQRQRVALGRAIVRNPKVFLMDEPLSNLDARLRAQTRLELEKLHQQLKVTTVYVTHDQVEAMTLGQRVVVLHQGVIQQVGKPDEVYRHPKNRFVAEFMGQISFLKAVFTGSHFVFEGTNTAWQIPSAIVEKLRQKCSDDTAIEIGVRPEQFSILSATDNNPDEGGTGHGRVLFETKIMESLGKEKLYYGEFSGQHLVVQMPWDTANAGTFELKVRLDKLNYFDPVTGKNLIWG